MKDRLGDRLISISIITGMHADRFVGEKPRSGDLGILGSLDPTAVDQAACDLVWGLKPDEARKLSLREKIDSGYLQLECQEGIGSGSRAYRLVRI